MATFAAIFSPKSASGGISDDQQVVNLAGQSASSSLVIGVRQKIAISVTPGAGGTPTLGAAVRFGFGSVTAASTDFIIPLNTVLTFDMGDEFNNVGFFNMNLAANQLNICVMRLTV